MVSKMEVLARKVFILTYMKGGDHHLLHYLLHFCTTVPQWKINHRNRKSVDRMINHRKRKRINRGTRSNDQYRMALRTRNRGNPLRSMGGPWLTSHRLDYPIVLLYSQQGRLEPHLMSRLISAGPRNWTSSSNQHLSRNCRAQTRPGSRRHP